MKAKRAHNLLTHGCHRPMADVRKAGRDKNNKKHEYIAGRTYTVGYYKELLLYICIYVCEM